VRICPNPVGHTELGWLWWEEVSGVFGLMHTGEELGVELMLQHHRCKEGGQQAPPSLGFGKGGQTYDFSCVVWHKPGLHLLHQRKEE